MAFSSTSLKRSLTLLAGGVIAFAMVWYFKSRQRQRNYKQVKSKAKELTNKAADNQDLEVIATDQCVHDNTKPLTDSDDKANVKENYVVCAAVENDTFNDGFGNLDKSALKDNEVKSSDGNDSNSSFISSLASSENEADVDESNADRNKVSTDDVKKPEKYMDFEISEEPFSWSEEVKNSTIRMNKENEDPGDKSKTFETEDDAGYKSEKSPTVHSEEFLLCL
uniref:Ovule protein n=1 Tax=Syphacia muris TaxID=451379 RepID=A0A158R3U9_9BILA